MVSGNVVLEVFDNVPLFLDDEFHHVADGNDSNKIAMIYDWQVANKPIRHYLHTIVHAILR